MRNDNMKSKKSNKKKIPLIIFSIVILAALVVTGVGMIFVIRGEMGEADQEQDHIISDAGEDVNSEDLQGEPSENENLGEDPSDDTMDEENPEDTENDDSQGELNQDSQMENQTGEVDDDPYAWMSFKEVNEVVTAKDRTNLRDKPSQGEDSTVMYTLANGETATRIAASDYGWSKVVFNGETYYAVSSFLTTDLNYKTPTPTPDDGVDTEFKEVNHKVTAKDVVNLRTLPSVTREDSVVVVQIKNGDVVTRTGINTELGWSRVVYDGQTLYCVSSYLISVD